MDLVEMTCAERPVLLVVEISTGRTVNTHLRQVFAKLGVPKRVALAAMVHHSIK